MCTIYQKIKLTSFKLKIEDEELRFCKEYSLSAFKNLVLMIMIFHYLILFVHLKIDYEQIFNLKLKR